MKVDFTEAINSQFANLIKREISPSDIGVTPRVFNCCKKVGIIDYSFDLPEGRRTRVKLNFFEAFWMLIVQELRGFGMSDKSIIELKEIVHQDLNKVATDMKVNMEERIEKGKEMIDIGPFDKNEIKPEEVQQFFDSIPDEERIYLSILGVYLGNVILFNSNPLIKIYSNRNPDGDYGTIGVELDNGLPLQENLPEGIEPSDAFITIPLRPLYERLFNMEVSDKVFHHYRLLTDREEQIIRLLRSGEYKECVIKNVDDEPILKIKNNGEILGEKVKEIRRLLGLKDYKNITLKFRNDKHIYYENER